MGRHAGAAGTTKDIVARLNAEINKALASEDVRAKLLANSIDIQGGTPERFADYIRGEVGKMGPDHTGSRYQAGVIQVVFLLVPIPRFRGY